MKLIELLIQPWLVVFLQPQEVFLAPGRAQTRSALLLATLIAGIVVMVAAGMGQLLSRPITRLTAVIRRCSRASCASMRPSIIIHLI